MMPQWIQRHRGSVLLAFLLLTCAGILSLRALPVGLFPLIDFPRIVVSVDAGDRPVDRMVVEVTRPLEQALRSVPDVKTIRSNTSRGSAEFSLSFGWGTDMVTALLQTQAEVNAALSSLPAGTSFGIRRMDPTVFPVLGLSLTSPTRSQTSLREVAQYQIAPELTAIGGVAKVDLMGGRQAEYHVLLDPVQQFGALKTISHVGQQDGADLFRVVFEKQATDWVIAFNDDDQIAALLFRPARD